MTVLIFPFWFGWLYLFIYFCLNALTRTFSTMVNKSGKKGHPCLISDLRGKACGFSMLTMMLAMDLSFMAFIMLTYIPSIATLLRLFIISRYWTLSHAFSACTEIIIWVFVLHCVNMVYHVDWLINVTSFFYPWNKYHLIMVYDSFSELLNLIC